MTGKAHAALGAAIGGLIAYSIRDADQQAIVITMSVIGSLAPDIDHVKSRISQRFPIVSMVVSNIFGHRKFLHSPACVFILWLFLRDFSFGMAFVYGYIGHLLQDFCTKGGIPLFFPFSKRKLAILPFRTGSKTEMITTSIIILLIFGFSKVSL